MPRKLTFPTWLFRPEVGLGATAMVLAGLTGVLAPLLAEHYILQVALLYLLVVLIASALWGYAVGLTAAVAADLLVNFFFVPPLHRFTVQDASNVVALAIFLAVAGVGASMLALLQRQLQIARARREETATLLQVSQQLARAVSPRDAMYQLCQSMARAVHARTCSVLVKAAGWQVLAASSGPLTLTREEMALAEAALTSGQAVRSKRRGGVGMRSPVRAQPDNPVLFVPFPPESPARGALRLTGNIAAPAVIDEGRLLEAFGSEASLAVVRLRLAEEANRVEALDRANQLKSALLSSISHDLRSPLTAIKAAVGSLKDDTIAWEAEDRSSFLNIIEAQTDRLTATVTDLLEMSRLEGGATQPSLEPIEARPLLVEAALACESETRGRPIRIDAPEGLWLRADYGLILRALENLIVNAGRYSIPGGTITLTASRQGVARLSVADEGPGIEPDDLPHIFEKFYRGAKTRPIAGTGLGLSIVKAMVELCNGSVSVTSGSAGTVFTAALPLSPPPRA